MAETEQNTERLPLLLVRNESRGTVVADKARRARGFVGRGRGLMLSPELPQGGALIIEPCNSIHMFFMRYALDIIFADASGKVLFMYEGIKPWRMGRLVRGARLAIELPVGAIADSMTAVGDKLSW